MAKEHELLSKGGPIPPLYNNLFLKLFGSMQTKHFALSLVNAILAHLGLEPIEDVLDITADAAQVGGIEAKCGRIDVLLITDDDTYVGLEAQRRRVNVDNKLLFYGSRIISRYTPKGDNDGYDEMPSFVGILLLEGQVIDAEDDCYISEAMLRWNRNGKLKDGTDHLRLIVVELDKVRKRYTASDGEVTGDELTAWLYFLAAGYLDADGMEQDMGNFPTLTEFAKRYKIEAGDEELRRQYDQYVEATLERNAERNYLRKEAFEEGIEDGRQSLADSLRDLGVDEGVIAEALRRSRERARHDRRQSSSRRKA